MLRIMTGLKKSDDKDAPHRICWRTLINYSNERVQEISFQSEKGLGNEMSFKRQKITDN